MLGFVELTSTGGPEGIAVALVEVVAAGTFVEGLVAFAVLFCAFRQGGSVIKAKVSAMRKG
jgi:hypothetical protein